MAALLFAASFFALRLKRDGVAPAKILFCMAAGFFGFSFFRLMLFYPFRDNLLWFSNWEELTELFYIAGVGVALWIFRRGLWGPAAGQAGQPG